MSDEEATDRLTDEDLWKACRPNELEATLKVAAFYCNLAAAVVAMFGVAFLIPRVFGIASKPFVVAAVNLVVLFAAAGALLAALSRSRRGAHIRALRARLEARGFVDSQIESVVASLEDRSVSAGPPLPLVGESAPADHDASIPHSPRTRG